MRVTFWTRRRTLICVRFEVKWNFYCRRCAVICPTPGTCSTAGLVTNVSRYITKDSFPSNSFQFIILSRYHYFHITWHWNSSPLLILYKSHCINELATPPPFQTLTPFDTCYAGSLDNSRFPCSSVSKKLVGFSTLGVKTHSWFCLIIIDILNDRRRYVTGMWSSVTL